MNLIPYTRTIFLLPLLFLLLGFDKSHMEELEEKSEELEEAETIANNVDFLQESSGIEWDISYHEWADARQEAKTFKEESGGRFSLNWGTYMIYQSKKRDISPALVYELLKVETGGTFDPTLTGPQTKYGHAYGLAQFMKNTGPWIADLADLPYSDSMLFDPYYSIQLSIEYLDYLHDKYDNWDQALTAYHRGISGLKTYEEENGDAKSWYAVEIQEKAEDKQELLAKQ